MPSVRILKAKFEDLPDILNLVRELALFEKEPDAVKATLKDYENAFNSKLISCFIAQVEGNTIGMTLFYDTFSTWRGKMLYLEDFYVKPEYRSLNIGSQLFDAVISEAKERNCTMMKWQVLNWNVGAIKFYKRKNATIEEQWYNGKIIF